jgi:hypothetical protein
MKTVGPDGTVDFDLQPELGKAGNEADIALFSTNRNLLTWLLSETNRAVSDLPASSLPASETPKV